MGWVLRGFRGSRGRQGEALPGGHGREGQDGVGADVRGLRLGQPIERVVAVLQVVAHSLAAGQPRRPLEVPHKYGFMLCVGCRLQSGRLGVLLIGDCANQEGRPRLTHSRRVRAGPRDRREERHPSALAQHTTLKVEQDDLGRAACMIGRTAPCAWGVLGVLRMLAKVRRCALAARVGMNHVVACRGRKLRNSKHGSPACRSGAWSAASDRWWGTDRLPPMSFFACALREGGSVVRQRSGGAGEF